MRNYNDKELNRILTEADQLLSDIQLYETPEEERERKQREEVRRQAEEEARKQAEQRRQEAEEARKQAEQQQQEEEEARKQAEQQQQEAEEARKQAELQQQKVEEARKQAEQQQKKEKVRQRKPEQLNSSQEVIKRKYFLWPVLFWMGSLAFMEALLHFSLYHRSSLHILYPLLASMGIGCFIAIVVSLFSAKVNYVLTVIFMVLLSGYYDFQMFYHTVTDSYFNLTVFPEKLQLLEVYSNNMDKGFSVVLSWGIVLFLPVLFLILTGGKRLPFYKGNWRSRLILLFAGMICLILMVLTLDIHGYKKDSPYVCFYQFESGNNLEPAGKQLGITVMTGLEVYEAVQ